MNGETMSTPGELADAIDPRKDVVRRNGFGTTIKDTDLIAASDLLRTIPSGAEGERGEAIALANRMLDRINADPDDDLAVLSRQLLRAVEFRAEISRALRSVTTTPDTGREG